MNANEKPINPQNLITTSLIFGSSLCHLITRPIKYEQATKITAANAVVLLRMNKRKVLPLDAPAM